MQYFGGKSRIAKHIAKEINAKLKTNQPFVDLFCGSCNVISKIDDNRLRIANDKHPYLISMFRKIQLGEFTPPDFISEERYSEIKLNQDEDQALSGFVGFSCSFSGKWWGGYARNKRGDNFCKQSKRSLVKKFESMKDVVFCNEDYSNLWIPKNSLVYCDIPYKGTTQYSNIVGEFSHDDFYLWVKRNSNNFTIIISEYKTNVPNGFDVIWEYESNKEIRNRTNTREKTIEVLITPR